MKNVRAEIIENTNCKYTFFAARLSSSSLLNCNALLFCAFIKLLITRGEFCFEMYDEK